MAPTHDEVVILDRDVEIDQVSSEQRHEGSIGKLIRKRFSLADFIKRQRLVAAQCLLFERIL